MYWRVAEHLDVTAPPADDQTGCAIQHFSLLGNDEMAAWLLSLRQRVDAMERTRAL